MLRLLSARQVTAFALAGAMFLCLTTPGVEVDAKADRTRLSKARGSSSNPLTIGNDGAFVAPGLDTVVNTYAELAVDVTSGSASFDVTNITDLDSPIPQLGPIAVGDLLMLIQMQGATIDTSDSATYGTVTSLNGSGSYEFVTIGSISGNTITINGEGCILGLRNAYTTAGRTQVVRVPQFSTLDVPLGTSIVPAAWNGSVGGIVAIQTAFATTIDGTIEANGDGFRGGALDTLSAFPSSGGTYRSVTGNDGSEKGESIAGNQTDYDLLGGRYSRGAPANGGGGGNSHNAGGGGGSNGNNGNTWTGQGVMPTTPAAAWALDPGYIANGNTFTTSSGGGRGGYTYSANDADALVSGPGDPAWAGDNRLELGGLGGHPLANDPAARLFMGGGGGAGDANNSSGGVGGNGGGIVFLMSSTVSGAGTVTANGANGQDTSNFNIDAPGGGGGGGTIVLASNAVAGVVFEANGGSGGNQLLSPTDPNEGEGPGGGGGGGYIAVRTGTPSRTAVGGSGGTTATPSLTEFVRNGSTDGAEGQPNEAVLTFPICIAPTAAQVSISGRVVNENGFGISGTTVMVESPEFGTRRSITGPFGFFEFTELEAGVPVVVSVSHRSYVFDQPSVLITPQESITDVVFQAGSSLKRSR